MGKVLAGALLGLLILVAPAARAEADAGRIAAAKQAADEFLKRAEGSATSGRMPRRTDPEIARLLDTVFDLSALGTEPVPMAKIAPVGELATNANRIGMAYILAGTGQAAVSGADPAVLRRVDENTVTFAPEVGQFTDFQLGVTETMAKSALDFMAAATPAIRERPNVKAGLAQMRGGFGQTIGGVLKTFAIGGLPDAWKTDRMAVLERIQDTAGRFLGEGDKASVRQIADEVAALVGPPLRGRVQDFARSLSAAR